MPKRVQVILTLHCPICHDLCSRWPLRAGQDQGTNGKLPVSTSAISFPPGLFYIECLSPLFQHSVWPPPPEHPAQYSQPPLKQSKTKCINRKHMACRSPPSFCTPLAIMHSVGPNAKQTSDDDTSLFSRIGSGIIWDNKEYKYFSSPILENLQSVTPLS